MYKYPRIKELLENKNRSKLLEIIKVSEGVCHSELTKETELASGTVYYHLRVLINRGLIRFKKEGVYKKYYAKSSCRC